MRILSLIAVFFFIAGAVLLAGGFALRGSGVTPASRPASFDLRSTPTVQVALESPSPTPGASPTPTATPFAGSIARMIAPSIGLDHPVEEIGFVPGTNQLDAPNDALHVGWYGMYPAPGSKANAVFAAHINFDKQNGPFAHLADISPRAAIRIRMEDGPTYEYEVIYSHRYDVDTIAMGDLIAATTRPADAEWITLITCGGDFQADPGSEFGHYLQRDVVIAQRVR
jgi:sortase (surface protein transpeptidase)